MKTHIVQAILIVLVIIAESCASNKSLSDSKSVITPLSGKINLSEGSLVYGLPLTVIDVYIETERVIEKPGPYARFAEDLLGLKDVVRTESEYWTIKGITIKTHEELDPSEFYVIETNNLFQTNALALKKEGLILDLNPELFNTGEGRIPGKEADLNRLRVFDLGADEYFQARSDTAFKLVRFDTAFIKIPYLVEKKQKLTVDQLAETAARRLMEMRDGKHLILTGEANVFPQDEAAINEMNRLEKEYIELFAGKTWKETRIFTYQIIPRKELTGKQVTLFRFSEMTGPEESEGKNGIPVVAELIPELKTRDLTIITQRKTDQSSPKHDKLFYRVPDVVNLKISFGNEVLNNSRRLIYQFGEVIQLPANFIIGK